MAGTAVRGRLTWETATVGAVIDETSKVRTLSLDVPGWGGHQAGQHLDIALTGDDGYRAERSYSIASAPGEPVAITVERLDDGEVSPYLTEIAEPGDQLEMRGPIGGWFAWPSNDPRPLLLLAGGSGIVPLMSMIRAHGAAKSEVPVGLIYSVRSPADVIYQTELSERSLSSPLTVDYRYTRSAPPGKRPGRIDAAAITRLAPPPAANPDIFVCGPSGFVEAATSLLVDAGHTPATIKTERFGPTGT